VLMAHKNM